MLRQPLTTQQLKSEFQSLNQQTAQSRDSIRDRALDSLLERAFGDALAWADVALVTVAGGSEPVHGQNVRCSLGPAVVGSRKGRMRTPVPVCLTC